MSSARAGADSVRPRGPELTAALRNARPGVRIAPLPPRVARVALLALLGLGCPADSDFDPGPTATVEVAAIERIVVATGTIEPEREVEVRPRIAGIIQVIHVEAGDVVEKGQVLIEIDREILEAQVQEAEAAVREAQVELRFAKIELERTKQLEKRGAGAARELDKARASVQGAEARLARTRANLQSLSVQLRHATVTSPLAGRVLDVFVEEGNAVSPVTSVTGGTLLLSLAATASIHLKGLVDENEIARVKVGQQARIRTEAYEERLFRGVIQEISPVGQRIQNVTYFEVEIEVTDDGEDLLRPRMSGDADIVTEVIEDALVIPETALRYEGERIYVEALAPGDPPAIVERDVEIGVVDGTRVQVLNGLDTGEEVLLH